VVVGPAAAHDPAAVLEFARRLKPVADSLRDQPALSSPGAAEVSASVFCVC
jgi:phospho-2-dehydro-3-deoxyheptonate aldolase